jgi:Fe-Mn family superoxide dismutase
MSWNKGIEYLIRRDFGSTADFALALQDTVRDMPTSGYVWLVQELLGHEHKLALKTTLGSGTILIPARQQGEQSMAFEEEEVMALPELPGERPTGEPGGKNRPDVVEKPWEATPSEEVSTFVPPFSSEFDSGRPSRPDDIPNPSSPLRSTSRSPSTTPSVSSSLSPSPSPPKTDPSGHVWRQIIQPLACLSVHERVYLQDYGFGGKEEYARAWLATVDWNKVWMNTSKRHEKLGWSPIPVKEQEKLKKVTKPKDSYR